MYDSGSFVSVPDVYQTAHHIKIIGIQKEMKSPTSERGGNNRNTKGDEIADERARSEEQNPQRGFCDERRASEEEARLLNIFI